MMLPKIGIVLILFWANATQVLGDWIHGSETYNGTYYVDYGRIEIKDTISKMTHMIDYPRRQVSANGLPFYSELVTFEYNCKKAESRLFSHQTYSGRKGAGKVVFPRKWHSPWKQVMAGTREETLWRIACGVVESDNIITDYNLANPVLEDE